MGVEANVLDCGRFFFFLDGRGGGFNDNADRLRSIVQRGGPGVGQVGGRSAMTQDPKRMDRRFGVRTGVMKGGLFPVIKKNLKKGRALGLYLMELMLLSMGSSMGAQRLLLCRSPLASIRSVHTSAQGDLRQTLNSLQ